MEKKQVNSIFASLRQKHYKIENEEDHYNSVDVLSEDPEMKMIIQKINKKSQKTTTTRKKALEEMLQSLHTKNPEYFKKFVKMFLLILEKLAQAENSKEILTTINDLVTIFIKKNPKVIKKNFDQFFPVLFFLSFNDFEEIQNTAKLNLDSLLKNDEKKAQAFELFYKQFIEFVTPYLQNNESHFENISIYQNKETDKIIFQRNKAIAYNCMAESLKYSKFWKDSQKQEILQNLLSLIFTDNSSKKKKPQILMLYEECKYDYIMKTSITKFISAIFSNNLEDLISNDIKKIIDFYLFKHLDENLQTVQKIYWNENFIFNLIQKSKELKYDIIKMEEGLKNLVKNSGYGAGQSYYMKLPELLLLTYENRNWNTLKKNLNIIINLHFRALNESKQTIDVEQHIQAGFNIFNKFLENKQEVNDEYQELQQELIPQYLLQVLQIFIELNLPQQRNLFVLGVNNIKHIAPQLCQYFQYLNENKSTIISENFIKLFVSYIKTDSQNFKKSEIQNISIFSSYVVKTLGKFDFFDELLKNIFEVMYHLLFTFCENIDETNFSQQYQSIYNLEFFFGEICQQKLHKQLQKSEKIVDVINQFDKKIQNYFVEFVINNKIAQQLLKQTSIRDFTELLCQLLRVLNNWINYDIILDTFLVKIEENNKLQQPLLKTNIVLFFYENQAGTKTLQKESVELDQHISSLLLNKQQNLPFFVTIIKQNNLQKIMLELQQKIFLDGTDEYRPIISKYIQNNLNVDRLVKNLQNILDQNKIELSKKFQHNLILLLQLFQQSNKSFEENQRTLTKLVIDLMSQKEIDDHDMEMFNILDKQQQLRYFEIMFNELFQLEELQKNKKIFLKTYMNIYIQKDNELKQNYKDYIFQIIELQKTHNKPKLFRILIEHFQIMMKIGDTIIKACQTIEFNDFYCQQYINQNLLSHKESQFWNNFNQEFINGLMELEESNIQNFNKIMNSILQTCFDQIYSFSFLYQFLYFYCKSSEKDQDQKEEKVKLIFDNFFINYQKNKNFQQLLYFEQLMQVLPQFLKRQTYKYLDSQQLVKEDFLLKIIYFLEKNQNIKNNLNILQTQDYNQQLEEFSKQNNDIIHQINAQDQLGFYEKGYLILKVIQLCLLNDVEIVLAENIEQVEDIFLKTLSSSFNYFEDRHSQNCYYQMLKLLRKLIVILDMFSENTQKDLLQQVLTSSFNLISNLQKLEKNQTIILDDFLEEIAETISRFGLDDKQTFKINDILKLYEIEINSIKKSAFYLLHNLKYEIQVNEELLSEQQEDGNFDFKLIQDLPKKFQQILENPQSTSFSSFLLYWHILIYYCDGLNEENKKNQQILSQLFTIQNSFFSKMLNRIFKYFINQKLTDRELKDLLERYNLLKPEENWKNYLTKEMLDQFAFHIILKISSMFPLSMRKWLDNAEKKQRNFGYLVMKTKINQIIFEQEIENIELNQKDWKDENFNIFLKKRTKEINLVYTQDDVNIELTLKIPDNYPLQGLDIKMHENKSLNPSLLLKFKIMIVKLLNKENLNLVNAIVKWKENIDKDFLGYEPCPICYYVIDSTTSQLPKKDCKNCKKKFHSSCIFKWFKTSGHSDCPMCKSNFL